MALKETNKKVFSSRVKTEYFVANLPYFDVLLAGRSQGDVASKVFDRYVHWGYFENPKKATKDRAEFIRAMDRLNSEVIKEASLKDGQKVLDVGCGFGGTLASIQANWQDMSLTGVNIDARQLEIAKEQVPTAKFVQGDACALPFKEAFFDRVLAVECIFHFPSRLKFLKEAARVLKPGGRIAISDFVPWKIDNSKSWIGDAIKQQICKGYGEISGDWQDGDYQKMAKMAGLRVLIDRDITVNTLPTYLVLQDLFLAGPMVWPTRLLKWASKLRLVRYRIISFVKD